MANRTFCVGDVHGDLEALKRTIAKLPPADESDTMVFMGDYMDRGPDSKGVVDYVRTTLPKQYKGKLVCLRGNHEDGWLRVAAGGWPEFVVPLANGCLATLRSWRGQPPPKDFEMPTKEELEAMQLGDFLGEEVLAWMGGLPYFYEDEHALYVHAGLVERDGKFLHPMDTPNPVQLLWVRTMKFFQGYRGKLVICGHTATENLPPELSSFTPEDPLDMWVGEAVNVIDTGCGKGGFLTILELPDVKVYESRG